MLASLGSNKVEIPPELLPRCPHCGWLMTPWVRDETFLEGSYWNSQRTRYEQFVSHALKHGKHVLFLELGVGGMTPSVIELPFWDMTAHNNNACYLRINKGKVSEPRQLNKRSLTVSADIAEAITRICTYLDVLKEV